MRIVRMLSLACAGTVMVSAQPAGAQDVRAAVIHIHKAGDTVSVVNAVVTIDHVIEAGKTDSRGIVRVEELEDGGHIIEVSAPGYQYIFDQFDSGPNVKQPIEIEVLALAPRAALKGPTTGLRFADFDRRRTGGQGTFLTKAQLDAAAGRPLANLLKVDAGASIVSGQRGGSFVALSAQPNPSNPCYAAVVRDGVRVYPVAGVANPPDLDRIFAEQLAAVEFYPRPALVPAELRDASACGALVIWTREGAR
jgi:hypothetical protein